MRREMDGAVRKPVRDEIDGGVGRAVAHDSARLHVTGEAIYIDDIPQVPGTLQAHIAQSTKAHARIASLDVSQVRVAPGVIAVLTAADIPGDNDVSPTPTDDDPVFAKGLVEYVGQSIFAVVADTLANARAAAALAIVVYDELPAIITIEQAMVAQQIGRAHV